MPLPRFDRLPVDTRAAILAVARDNIARNGREGASLSGIAVDAGFSRSAAYTWFDGRDDLLDTVRDDTVARLLDVVGDWADAPDRAAFWQAFGSAHSKLVDALTRHPADRVVLAAAGLDTRSSLTMWIRVAFRNAVAIGMVDRTLDSGVLEEVTVAVVEALDGVEIATPGHVDADMLRTILTRLWSAPHER